MQTPKQQAAQAFRPRWQSLKALAPRAPYTLWFSGSQGTYNAGRNAAKRERRLAARMDRLAARGTFSGASFEIRDPSEAGGAA